jgi:nitrite transporter NirC
MYHETLEQMSNAAIAKAKLIRGNPGGYLVSSMLAGIYVGLGIALIFTIGSPLAAIQSPWLKTVMGMCFGIALSLVIIAGSELFTGNNLMMMIGKWNGKVTAGDVANTWWLSWVGNLLGALLLSAVLQEAGIFNGINEQTFIQKIASTKMSLPAVVLLYRGILCNILVCLAIWCAARVKSEAAKLVMIFWCLFAFITLGFEHSVANMTLLGVAMFQNPLPEFAPLLTWTGFGYNLFWVTLGNIIGGTIVIAGSYWYISKPTVATETNKA